MPNVPRKVSTQEYLDGLEFLIKNEIITVPGYVQIAQAQSVDQGSLDEVWTTINSLQIQVDDLQLHLSQQDSMGSEDNELQFTVGDLSIENPGNEARILLGTNDTGNNDVIAFDDGSKVFFWREANDRFEMNEDLAIQGDLNLAVPFEYDDDRILFDDGNKILMWDESESRFDFSNDVNCPNCINGFYNKVQNIPGLTDTGATWFVACDEGDILTGGGYSTDASSGNQFPLKAYPTDTRTFSITWLATITGSTYSSHATCADYPPVHIP